jgi:hypothetical protein
MTKVVEIDNFEVEDGDYLLLGFFDNSDDDILSSTESDVEGAERLVRFTATVASSPGSLPTDKTTITGTSTTGKRRSALSSCPAVKNTTTGTIITTKRTAKSSVFPQRG